MRGTRTTTVVAILAGWLVVLPASPASAACHWEQVVDLVDGAAQVKSEQVCSANEAGGHAQVEGDAEPVRDSDWDAICVRTAMAVGASPDEYCDLPPGVAIPTVTPGLVGRAFRRLPLPQAELMVQPPGGETLVNFAANFYTEQGGFTRTVRLLGQRVELRIWPSRFGWRFGDGEFWASTSAGSPYPDLEITHEYARATRVHPRVDTTYAAEFSVNGGPWRPVNGTVTIPGAPVTLRVLTASPVLVG